MSDKGSSEWRSNMEQVLPELLVLCIVCTPGFIRTIYRGSHAHPETDVTNKGADEHIAPEIAETDGVRPATPTGTHPTGTTAVNGNVPSTGTTPTPEAV